VLSNYFATSTKYSDDVDRYLRLASGGGPAGTVGARTKALMTSLTALQRSGCIQITWTVHHVERPGAGADFQSKMRDLCEHRPVT
jgi:hypothetical protein